MVTNTGFLRSRVKMPDRDIVYLFKRLGFVSEIEAIAFTTETVEDFVGARHRSWHRSGEVEKYEAGGLLVVKNAQPQANQPTRDIAVISLGSVRAVIGVLPNPDIDPLYPRYAARMG